MSFEKLGLSPAILAGVKAQGYNEPTPIQSKAIPIIMQGRDILAGAQTGTGKTAAFTLPLLHLLTTNKHPGGHLPRALVLAPTRELAAQVGASIQTYGQGLSIESTVIFGGVGINPQKKRLRQGVEIVIGTPGRLLDLAGQKDLNLSRIEVLILDEADRMLDMGFIHDIRKIIKMVPKQRQTLFFSATYSKEIKALSDTILNKPELVEVARRNTAAENVAQSIYYVPKSRKRDLLSHLIKEGEWSQVLVFTRTKHGANRLAKQLCQDGIESTAIHGNKSQAARTRALADFKAGQVRVLVATDIAARGLDIVQLPHVVNYEIPNVPEDYIHRIGRTGRAGCNGEAISLVMKEEGKLLQAIERLLKKTIKVNDIEGFSTPAIHRNDGNSSGNNRHQSGGGSGQRGGRTRRSGGGKRGSSSNQGRHNSERTESQGQGRSERPATRTGSQGRFKWRKSGGGS
ncbi:MAG: DEAD/DEAH box helicase [Victivallaceae bacterium]|nr:DEAD/DEAH box helicase [Victivallaceae bacterium]